MESENEDGMKNALITHFKKINIYRIIFSFILDRYFIKELSKNLLRYNLHVVVTRWTAGTSMFSFIAVLFMYSQSFSVLRLTTLCSVILVSDLPKLVGQSIVNLVELTCLDEFAVLDSLSLILMLAAFHKITKVHDYREIISQDDQDINDYPNLYRWSWIQIIGNSGNYSASCLKTRYRSLCLMGTALNFKIHHLKNIFFGEKL